MDKFFSFLSLIPFLNITNPEEKGIKKFSFEGENFKKIVFACVITSLISSWGTVQMTQAEQKKDIQYMAKMVSEMQVQYTKLCDRVGDIDIRLAISEERQRTRIEREKMNGKK